MSNVLYSRTPSRASIFSTCKCRDHITDTKLTGEKVRAGLLQPDGLLVQFARAAVGPGHEAIPHRLHALLAVRIQENDDGVPLGVVQGVHGFGSHIQQSVTILRRKE